MRSTTLVPIIAILSLSVIGCANTSSNLKRETARFIGDVSSDKVTVSDVKRGITDVTWTAETTDGRAYHCEADDMVRKVHCVNASTR